MNTDLIYEDETYAIRGAIYEVYKSLGTGYLEEVYQNALEEERRLILRRLLFNSRLQCRRRRFRAFRGKDFLFRFLTTEHTDARIRGTQKAA
jgi:hypothetical protein